MQKTERSQESLQEFVQLMQTGSLTEVSQAINELHPAEIAHLLESLPYEQRVLAWDLLIPENTGDVLLYVNDEVRAGLIRRMNPDQLVSATVGLDTDDLADILPDLPESVIGELLRSMDAQNRQLLESVLLYPEDTAGAIMSFDMVTIRPDVSLDVILRFLRFRGEIPEMTDNLFVINREGKFLGLLPLNMVLTKDPAFTVAELIDQAAESILVTTSVTEVARMFEQRDLVSAPVVDEKQILLGRITIDDVVDIIRDEADHSIMSFAGLDEEGDMFAPVVSSAQRRTVWLGINLITALLASFVIGLFGATIDQLVALAILMPIVASMGGIAGSQTLTLVIRGLALGHLGDSNINRLIRKELLVGVLNGVMWATVIGLLSWLWFHSALLGLIMGLAILFNLIVAAFAGATVPLVLRRFGIDPALAGGVLLTTITDVIGFFAFLGLATMFLV